MLQPNYIVITDIPEIFPYPSADFADTVSSPLSAQLVLQPTAGVPSSIVMEERTLSRKSL